jgi:hypothetical protein
MIWKIAGGGRAKWFVVLALVFLASCRSGSRETVGERERGTVSRKSDDLDEQYDMGLAVDRAIVEMLNDRLAQPEVLRNAVLLYRQENGRWPRGKDDVRRYVFNVDRYERLTFAPSADGGLVVEWVLQGSHGQGRFTIPPRDASKATTVPASLPRG